MLERGVLEFHPVGFRPAEFRPTGIQPYRFCVVSMAPAYVNRKCMVTNSIFGDGGYNAGKQLLSCAKSPSCNSPFYDITLTIGTTISKGSTVN